MKTITADKSISLHNRSRPRSRTWWALTQNDHSKHFVSRDVPNRCRANNLPVFHDGNAIGQIKDIFDVMADKKDADTFHF